jgi:hypothetical protein
VKTLKPSESSISSMLWAVALSSSISNTLILIPLFISSPASRFALHLPSAWEDAVGQG